MRAALVRRAPPWLAKRARARATPRRCGMRQALKPRPDCPPPKLVGSANRYKTVHAIMREMAGLFVDEVFNIGSDETAAKGRCTVNSTFAIERKMLTAIETEFNKTAEGWEEVGPGPRAALLPLLAPQWLGERAPGNRRAPRHPPCSQRNTRRAPNLPCHGRRGSQVYFDAGAATMKTIVDAWKSHTAADITATGHRAVESAEKHFYFTGPAPGGPAGWSKCWYDIGTGVPASQLPLLLGGEMSMWTDSVSCW